MGGLSPVIGLSFFSKPSNLAEEQTLESKNQRPLEPGIVTDLSRGVRYDSYLQLDKILDAQAPLSSPAHHDEMLFIVQHQVAELWFMLVLHELDAAIEFLQRDEPSRAIKILARVRQIQNQLIDQWSVLATLTPSEYMQFRGVLGTASGFQSPQYRILEFKLGNKNRALLGVFKDQPHYQARLAEALDAPSLYDEFLRHLHRAGYEVPADRVERDFAEPYESHHGVVQVFETIYRDPETHWAGYEFAEKLVDIETAFQLWRFRHLKTVERIIGFKKGTGGSSGVGFLARALDISFFPELSQVRTEL